MPRFSYRWTDAEWSAYYFNRSFNLLMLNLLNLAAGAFATSLAMTRQVGPDAAALAPAIMLCINMGVIYAYLDDIKDGWWAGIAFGVSFGVPTIIFAVGLDYHLSPLYPAMAGLATVGVFVHQAMKHYAGAMSLRRVTVTSGRSRRH